MTVIDGGYPKDEELLDTELLGMTFAPVKYAVPGMIVEGCTLMAGAPKVGKSWFCLDVALAIASGGSAFGSIPCQQGDVIYCALEDSLRRLKDRIVKQRNHEGATGHLTIRTRMPPIGDGCEETLTAWAQSVDAPRMAIIDTLAKVRGEPSGKATQYADDYRVMGALQAWAQAAGIALLIVHHTRKQDSTDRMDKVSGTNGLKGAADSVLVLDRDANSVTLQGEGRDIEPFEKALQFDKDQCRWSILGEAAEIRRSDERKRITDALALAGEPLSPADIAAETGQKAGNVRRLLLSMHRDGEVEKPTRGKYRLTDLYGGSAA